MALHPPAHCEIISTIFVNIFYKHRNRLYRHENDLEIVHLKLHHLRVATMRVSFLYGAFPVWSNFDQNAIRKYNNE